MQIPERYQPELLADHHRAGWLDWSLDFFTDQEVLQNPYVDITLQLEVSNAYALYQKQAVKESSFFAFLVWHFMQTLKNHLSFKLRLVNDTWYIIHNPPIFIPVAIGGHLRFSELVLNNVTLLDYQEFSALYRQELNKARAGQERQATAEDFYFSYSFGNLPNLQFTGLTLHYRQENISGQTMFYFGKRYEQAGKMYIPLAVKLHHACTDPFVLDLFLQDFQQRMLSGVEA
jgi:chloramphenicol O-acetyltransferase